MTLQELQAERNRLAAKIREFGDKFNKQGEKWADQAEQDNWAQLNKDYDAVMAKMAAARASSLVTDRITQLQEDEERSVHDGQIGRENSDGRRRGDRQPGGIPDEPTRQLALDAWARRNINARVTKEHRQAARDCGLRLGTKEIAFNLADTRAREKVARTLAAVHPSCWEENRISDRIRNDLSTGLGASGGYLVPATLMAQLEINMLAYSGMLQAADLMLTETGGEISWPTADDTSNEGEILGENASIGSSVDPSFGAVKFGAYKFSSKLIKVPYELLRDSGFDLAAFLFAAIGERLGRASETYFTNGTGGSQPRGAVTAATLGVTAASATSIAVDEVIQLQHAVNPAYRNGAAYMAHDNVLLHLRQKKDGDGQYLWQSGMRDGLPDRLAGAAVFTNQKMASSVATGNKTMLFGQLSKYKVRRLRNVRIRRLVERFADQDQEGFVGFLEQDGNLLDAGTAPIVYLQQA